MNTIPEESPDPPFTCPHCRQRSVEFHYVCPVCGRPFMRDYIDWRMHPRDPDLQGTLYHDPFWARVWLTLMILGIIGIVLIAIAGRFL